MCAVLADPHRAHWKSDETSTEAELRSTLDHFIAYSGRYEVDEAQGSVVHHIEIHVVPNFIGTDFKRRVSFEGSLLKLQPVEPLAGDIVEYTLTWERA